MDDGVHPSGLVGPLDVIEHVADGLAGSTRVVIGYVTIHQKSLDSEVTFCIAPKPDVNVGRIVVCWDIEHVGADYDFDIE